MQHTQKPTVRRYPIFSTTHPDKRTDKQRHPPGPTDEGQIQLPNIHATPWEMKDRAKQTTNRQRTRRNCNGSPVIFLSELILWKIWTSTQTNTKPDTKWYLPESFQALGVLHASKNICRTYLLSIYLASLPTASNPTRARTWTLPPPGTCPVCVWRLRSPYQRPATRTWSSSPSPGPLPASGLCWDFSATGERGGRECHSITANYTSSRRVLIGLRAEFYRRYNSGQSPPK